MFGHTRKNMHAGESRRPGRGMGASMPAACASAEHTKQGRAGESGVCRGDGARAGACMGGQRGIAGVYSDALVLVCCYAAKLWECCLCCFVAQPATADG